jgi:hypothetical protein
MRIIYCDNVFDHHVIEPDYEIEQTAAKAIGFDVSLISFEALIDGNITSAIRFVPSNDTKEIGIYRGWMLTPLQYEKLYHALLNRNIQLINTPEAYTHCHYLPNSYNKIENHTPKSYWTKDLNEASILSLAHKFGNHPIIVKDYVKSEKHHWDDACFIPNASNNSNVISVINRFIELRGTSLNEGIVLRAFENLEFLTDHSKSGMPLTKEFRLFFANKALIAVFNYWDEGDYGTLEPPLETFKTVAKNIDSIFFTMDIAQKTNGDWIIMELGDGQVAGLPENATPIDFYQELRHSFKS